jgi:carbon storage regulator
MLILTRGRAQTLMIGEDIAVTVLDIRSDRVRIGINAPRDIVIERPERLDRPDAVPGAASSPR